METKVKLTDDELKAMLDAEIRRQARWATERDEFGAFKEKSLDAAAQDVYDGIVADFKYNDSIVAATRSVNFNVAYVKRVVKKMREQMSEVEHRAALAVAEAGEVWLLDGLVEPFRDIAHALEVTKKLPLGGGERFKKLKGALAKRGAKNPGALAAYIGRKKYGKKRFASLSKKGKKRTSKYGTKTKTG